jgi:hypothetical protein
MHGATPCPECGYDSCLCDRKPSERPDATRIRKARSRQAKYERRERSRERFDEQIENYNRAADKLRDFPDGDKIKDQFLVHAETGSADSAPFLAAVLAQGEEWLELLYWWLATGSLDLPLPWDSREQLALGAMLAERRDPSGADAEAGGDAGRYLNEWYRSDWDWSGLARQLVRERSTDTTAQTDYRDLRKDGGRYQQRKKPHEIIGPPWFLRPGYLVECIWNGGRQYDLYGALNAKGKNHWDSPALHFGELGERKKVNRAIFKCPIPGAHRPQRAQTGPWPAWLSSYVPAPIHPPASPESRRPTWWGEGANFNFPPPWRPLEHPRDWQTDSKSLVRRKAPWIKIGLSWISDKRLETEDQKLLAWTLKRIDRLPHVRAELAKLVPGYAPPPHKPVNYFGTRGVPRPIDPWQIRAERRGWVRPRIEELIALPRRREPEERPLIARSVTSERANLWPIYSYEIENTYAERVHRVEKAPIESYWPDLPALAKETGLSEVALAKMRYTHPPVITHWERAHTALLRAHRLSHWRMRQSKSDRYRSSRWHGFLCEGGA